MKVIAPRPLIAQAAEVLADVRGHIVVVGATAIEVALSDATDIAITPTRDVDIVVRTDRALEVVATLEAAGLTRSDIPHERSFTWVGGDLKVQLVRDFHPFPKPPADSLPTNPVFAMAATPAHQTDVAFADAPGDVRLTCANALCLIALKHAAFGRTRPPDNISVARDYHDVHLLLSGAPEAILTQYATAEYEVRTRAVDAIRQLAAGGGATTAAAGEAVDLGSAGTRRNAEQAIRRTAMRALRALDLE